MKDLEHYDVSKVTSCYIDLMQDWTIFGNLKTDKNLSKYHIKISRS